MTYVWIGVGVQAFVSAAFCAVLADEKKRSVPAWIVLGLLFGIYSLVAVAGLPSLATDGGGGFGDGKSEASSASRQQALRVLQQIKQEKARAAAEEE